MDNKTVKMPTTMKNIRNSSPFDGITPEYLPWFKSNCAECLYPHYSIQFNAETTYAGNVVRYSLPSVHLSFTFNCCCCHRAVVKYVHCQICLQYVCMLQCQQLLPQWTFAWSRAHTYSVPSTNCRRKHEFFAHQK